MARVRVRGGAIHVRLHMVLREPPECAVVGAVAFSFAEQSFYFMKTLTREREQPSLGRRGFGGAGYASPGSNLPCASFLTLQRRLSFLKEVGRKGFPLVLYTTTYFGAA